MKTLLKSIYLFATLFCFPFSIRSQTLEQTKQFIIETIVNNPAPHYTFEAEFIDNKILIYTMKMSNGATFEYAFDVKGIKYIRDGVEYFTDGTKVPKIVVY